MTEENQVPKNTEPAREKVTPDSSKNIEESDDRSPTKTERDVLSHPKSEVSQQPDAVRDLVKPSADERSTDDDRSPTKTERSPGRTEK